MHLVSDVLGQVFECDPGPIIPCFAPSSRQSYCGVHCTVPDNTEHGISLAMDAAKGCSSMQGSHSVVILQLNSAPCHGHPVLQVSAVGRYTSRLLCTQQSCFTDSRFKRACPDGDTNKLKKSKRMIHTLSHQHQFWDCECICLSTNQPANVPQYLYCHCSMPSWLISLNHVLLQNPVVSSAAFLTEICDRRSVLYFITSSTFDNNKKFLYKQSKVVFCAADPASPRLYVASAVNPSPSPACLPLDSQRGSCACTLSLCWSRCCGCPPATHLCGSCPSQVKRKH